MAYSYFYRIFSFDFGFPMELGDDHFPEDDCFDYVALCVGKEGKNRFADRNASVTQSRIKPPQLLGAPEIL